MKETEQPIDTLRAALVDAFLGFSLGSSVLLFLWCIWFWHIVPNPPGDPEGLAIATLLFIGPLFGIGAALNGAILSLHGKEQRRAENILRGLLTVYLLCAAFALGRFANGGYQRSLTETFLLASPALFWAALVAPWNIIGKFFRRWGLAVASALAGAVIGAFAGLYPLLFGIYLWQKQWIVLPINWGEDMAVFQLFCGVLGTVTGAALALRLFRLRTLASVFGGLAAAGLLCMVCIAAPTRDISLFSLWLNAPYILWAVIAVCPWPRRAKP